MTPDEAHGIIHAPGFNVSGFMTIKGKATSPDIAHLAGVSQPTVSRALRGSPMVNEETRRRIQAIAEQLNYKVDKNASNLRTQHSGTLALLFFEDPTADESQINPFFLSMLGSITRACALQSYDLLISFQQLSTNWQADYEDSNKADGLILLGYGVPRIPVPPAAPVAAFGRFRLRWQLLGYLQLDPATWSNPAQRAAARPVREGLQRLAVLRALRVLGTRQPAPSLGIPG